MLRVSLPYYFSLFIYVRYTLNSHFFTAQRDTLWLMRLDVLLADVDLLPEYQTLLNHEHFFHDGNNRRTIFLTYWHGTIHHTLHGHVRDNDFVMKQWFINKSLVF